MLKKDVPVQKIIGIQEMQNVWIDLRYKVLIPRYETEEVIIEAYQYLNKDSNILDLGCGSGFIGLAIKKNIDCYVDLVDISNQAIKQTKFNAKLNNLDVNVFKSNWFKKVNRQYDLIISNPPYLNRKHNFDKSLKYDPKRALFAKDNGLKCYKEILKEAKKYLKENGKLIFEIDPFSATYFQTHFPKAIIKKDINQKQRIITISKNDL
nr:peptide chain release factor N(5)-glutamine methyltransferase [[Mycoplasma] anseris]